MIKRLTFLKILILIPLFPPLFAAGEPSTLLSMAQLQHEPLEWETLSPGLSLARYQLPMPSSVIRPEILLLKIDPKLYSLEVATARSVNSENTDIETIAKRSGAIAGINANFFDRDGNALGVVVRNGTLEQKPHLGGNVLTGVFVVEKGIARIIRREDFNGSSVETAFQAGPRLISNGEPLQLNSQQRGDRRSGIAITRDNEILLYATVLRFPGATLEHTQQMLLLPELNVKDALNLDGGGSSQLYVSSFSPMGRKIMVTGGDYVPVGLVVKKK